MKIIAVEEHFTVKDINDIYTKVLLGDSKMQQTYSKRNTKLASDGILTDFGERHLAAMDRSGIAVQIIGYGDNAMRSSVKKKGP